MQNAVSPRGWRRVFSALALILALVLAWLFAERIPKTIAIFVIAAFIAFGVRPIVMWLQGRGIPKPLAIAIVFAVLLLLAAVALVVIVPLTVEQIQQLIANAPAYISTLQAWMTSLEASLRAHVPGLKLSPSAFDLAQFSATRLTSFATSAYVKS